MPEYQRTPCSKQSRYLKLKWLQRDSNPQPLWQADQMIELFCEYLYVRCIWLYVFIMSRTSLRVSVYSQHRSVIWPVWLNRWVLVYELSGSRFESRCIHLSIVVCHNAVLVGKWSAACSDIPIEANNHIFYISLKVKLKAIIMMRGQAHPPKFSFSLKKYFLWIC